MKKVVVLGGGVGGTRVANLLRARGDGLQVTVVDSHGDHLYQPALLYLPFGIEYEFAKDERDLLHREIDLLVERVTSIDDENRVVRFESGGKLPYDVLVIATGARLNHESVPGLREFGHNFHCRRSTEKLREALESFASGTIVVGASQMPYKCPYSPAEFALMLHDWLEKRKLRQKSSIWFVHPERMLDLFGPMGETLEEMFRERGIEVVDPFRPAAVIGSRGVLASEDGRELPYDLLVMVPPHCGAHFLAGTKFSVEGNWVRTDPQTLQVEGTKGVYAMGDATNLPVPKLGAVAHFQSEVIVKNVLAEIQGRSPEARYDGLVRHFFETGGSKAMNVEYTYDRPPGKATPSFLANQKKVMLHRFYFRLVPRGVV